MFSGLLNRQSNTATLDEAQADAGNGPILFPD
jgi:hypothetical protein